MKRVKLLVVVVLLISLMLPSAALAKGPPDPDGGETAGNNLSYPVVWAEGVTKTLPGSTDTPPILDGKWWYWWGTEGTDPNIVPLSCAPLPADPTKCHCDLDPDDENPDDEVRYCDDGMPGTVGASPSDPGEDWVKAYLQKDEGNVWQAESFDSSATPVIVDLFDWGDNLESVDWYTNSQVRTEVVLFEDAQPSDIEPDPDPEPYPGEAEGFEWMMREYEMRHVDGWGIDEVHGLAATPAEDPTLGDVPILGPGTRATVYSPCPRLTIQKLMVPRESPLLLEDPPNLEWVPTVGWTTSDSYVPDEEENDPEDLINPPIFNESVHEGGDGPGFYSAEINVKGRIIFGYTWNVRNLHDDVPVTGETPTAAGDYRITFSLDETCGSAQLNTYFIEGLTEIVVPLEEEEVITASEEGDDGGDTGGATGVLVPAVFDDITGELTGGNYSYIDVRILDGRGGGGGSGGNGGGGGNGKGRAASIGVLGACRCNCVGAQCTCDCLEECQCNCECLGDQCTCACEKNCGCDCACEDGECTCDCMSTDCLQIQAQSREMAQFNSQLQQGIPEQGCPVEGCPCQDDQGTPCQEFRNQFQHTFQEVNQLRIQNVCGEEACSCQCPDPAACNQVQQRLQETLRLEDQLQSQCHAGLCVEDEFFFESLRATVAGLLEVISDIREGLNMYLPAVMQ